MYNTGFRVIPPGGEGAGACMHHSICVQIHHLYNHSIVDWKCSTWAVVNALTLPTCYEYVQGQRAPAAGGNHQARKAGAGKSQGHSNGSWLSCLSYVDGVATPSDSKTTGNVEFSILLQMLYTQHVILLASSSLKNIFPSCQSLLFLPVVHVSIPVAQKAFNTKVKIHCLLPFFHLSSLLPSILSCQYLL